MIGVVALVRFRRQSRFLRLAAALALAAISVSVLLAPAAEAHASQSAPAHVEADGTHLHHSHIPESCPACIALQLTWAPPPEQRPSLAAPPRYEPPATTSYTWTRGSRVEPKVARAPPL